MSALEPERHTIAFPNRAAGPPPIRRGGRRLIGLRRTILALVLRVRSWFGVRPGQLVDPDASPQIRGSGLRLTEAVRDQQRPNWLRLRRGPAAPDERR